MKSTIGDTEYLGGIEIVLRTRSTGGWRQIHWPKLLSHSARKSEEL
jgi:hypothetical protein